MSIPIRISKHVMEFCDPVSDVCHQVNIESSTKQADQTKFSPGATQTVRKILQESKSLISTVSALFRLAASRK